MPSRGRGAATVVWDLRPGEGMHRFICDVADPASVQDAMERTLEQAGTPAVLVTAAGVGSVAPLLDLEAAEWERVQGVNLRGTMLCLQAVARVMTEVGGGSIVCVSSISGRMPGRGMAAYCCSKAGVDMLVTVAAAELGAHGIWVNAVAPGITVTPMNAEFRAIPGMVDLMSSRTPLGGIAAPATVGDGRRRSPTAV